MSSSSHSPQPLVDGAGLIRFPDQPARDPFAELDDLMCVVEALCPAWPDRPTFAGSVMFLL